MEVLTTADNNLQKSALQCLLKASKKKDFANVTIKLPKYAKLLEGLCDDKLFIDMIPVITFGSQGESKNENADMQDVVDEE